MKSIFRTFNEAIAEGVASNLKTRVPKRIESDANYQARQALEQLRNFHPEIEEYDQFEILENYLKELS